MLAHHPLVGLSIALIAVVGANNAGQLRATAIGGGSHQRGERGSHGAATLGVIAKAHGHQQSAEVGITDAQLAIVDSCLADRLGREIGETDRDVHGRDDHFHRLGEAHLIEGVVITQELQQIERGQVARRVVQAHVLRAWIGCGDATSLGVRVPVVDGVVVLKPRIGTGPRRLTDLAEQLTGVNGLDNLTGGSSTEPEGAAFINRAHELVIDPHRVVGILVLHRGDVATT